MKGWKNKRKQNKKKKQKKKNNQPSDTCCLIDLSNMHIFTVTITQIVWTHLTNLFDLRYFCKLNPLSLLRLEKKYLVFGEYFCPTYLSYKF